MCIKRESGSIPERFCRRKDGATSTMPLEEFPGRLERALTSQPEDLPFSFDYGFTENEVRR
jgi:hypothetical protein